jgi:carbamoyl-phosphate synthase large subunit
MNLNLPDLAVDSFLGKGKVQTYQYPSSVVVKSPQFSFARLSWADPVLRVEMSSTGEAACFGKTYDEALLKSILATNTFDFSKKSVLLSLSGQVNKAKFLEAAGILSKLGYKIFATDTTAQFFKEQGLNCQSVNKAYEVNLKESEKSKRPNFLDIIQKKEVSFVVNLSQAGLLDEQREKLHLTDGFYIRRAAVDNQIPLFTDLHLARAFVKALDKYKMEDLEIKSYREYLNN